MEKSLSVNRLAWKLLEKLCANPELYSVKIEKTKYGALIVDAGINAKGGFQAGKIITEICMGGCGKVEISLSQYGDITLPTITVHTDNPVIATLGSQFAGWNIKEEDYFAIGSGPARALAQKPKEVYEKIGYVDDSDKAIVVLETDKHPPEKLVRQLAKDCRIQCENLAIILTPTASVAGATQVSGRIIETGVYKLTRLGLNPKTILYAWGRAPIPPTHPKFVEAMARTNDAILYGGATYYVVDCENEAELAEIVKKTPSNASKDYGKPFSEILKAANHDFYKIDPNIFAPAKITLNNVRTGRVFKAGEINNEALRKSFTF
ncbi:methenyltetrahydromethanopterin cyclohydrolase [Candidatus Bathyarchaeota archaeon]|nr:methenyltetrahydromethanopterin cyclohydrolase [Candidatus Bathyarchaeota archaeon]